jgi:hypothetical protein
MNIKYALVWDVKPYSIAYINWFMEEPAASILRAENGGNSFFRDDELRLQWSETNVFWPHKTSIVEYWTIA